MPATPDLGLVRAVAQAVEELGYGVLWTNDVPNADGLVVGQAMAEATSTIRLGVGAVALDRRPATEVASRLKSLDLPLDRLVLVVGVGFSPRPLQLAAKALGYLRGRFGEALTLGLAAMGPKMCGLAGALGDLALLNWMTPERIRWARRRLEAGMRRRHPDLPPVEAAAYVRAAAGPDAPRLIAAEAERYASMPHYRRHFEAMTGGGRAIVGVPLEEAGAAGGADPLAPYDEVLDHTVVRAVTAPRPANPEQALLEVARAARPKK
jgi:alkanesulfonate monooxygenase SsuD/methylene tetrahydromethanopterin reductase-like flavin-dependent oxidoreductase (luciferase family)